MPTASGTGPSRRAVLAAVSLAGVGTSLLVTATGCTGSNPAAGRPTADPADVAAANQAHAREVELLVAYDSAIDRHPGLADTLRAIRAHHAEHAQALVGLGLPGTVTAATAAGAGSTAGTGSATGGGGADAGPGTTTSPGPGTTQNPAVTPGGTTDTPEGRATTLAALTELERTAAAAHRTGCLASSASVAPLLASLCAAESAHAELVATAPATVTRK